MLSNFHSILKMFSDSTQESVHPKIKRHILKLDTDEKKREYKNLTGFTGKESEYQAYSAESITVTKDHPLHLGDGSGKPVHVIFSTLTLETGAQIICTSPVQMTVNNLIKN